MLKPLERGQHKITVIVVPYNDAFGVQGPGTEDDPGQPTQVTYTIEQN